MGHFHILTFWEYNELEVSKLPFYKLYVQVFTFEEQLVKLGKCLELVW